MALFGAGRVGSAVREALEAGGGFSTEPFPFPWSDPGGREAGAAALADRMAAGPGAVGRRVVVWAAGVCGFGATEEQAAAEMGAFEVVLGLARRLARRGPAGSVDFHLLSSAGGLFEGQTGVDGGSVPAPRRPYGRLKEAQERRAGAEEGLRVRIHRVSSVYGPLRPGHRRGLVCTLVGNTARGVATPMFGDPGTLRDYVFSGDVGGFVARTVLDPGRDRAPVTALLASGRAVSIEGVVAVVGRVLGREPILERSEGPDNRSDITFSPSALPVGYAPLDLEGGVRRVWEEFRAGT